MCNIKGKVLHLVVLLMVLFAGLVWAGQNPLLKAVEGGDLAIVKKFIAKKPAMVNAPLDKKGRAPLHIAAWKKQKEIVALLLEKGADLEMKVTAAKATPLHYAALGGDPVIVKMLLKKGAKVDSREVDNETPLYYAAYKGHLEVVKLLVAKGANVKGEQTKINTSPLRYAVQGGHLEVVKYLQANGADIHAVNSYGHNLLHSAAWRENTQMVEYLLEQGIPVNATSKNGRTPLQNASWRGNNAVVHLLLQKGANVDLADEKGQTAMTFAAKSGNTKTVAILLKAGAGVKFEDQETKRNLLHFAGLHGYGKIAAMLIEKGADVNKKDSQGLTPLHYAAKYSHIKVAKQLIAKGASTEGIKKNFGPSKLLQKKFDNGIAIVFYLGHSGWAVKTSRHFLVFDYYKRPNRPDTPFLANGCINPEEIKGLKTVVFSSHSHGDHYMPEIFQWKKQGVDATYVLGFKPKEEEEYILMGPRKTRTIGEMEVTTIKSNDAGVGFFVKVDGVSIYHPGDHTNRKNDFSEPFKEEIDFLAQKGLTPDLMFSPLTGCGATDQGSVKKGLYYTVKKIQPKTIFPMHALGQENRYEAFALEVKEKGLKTPVLAASNCGDYFVYKQGKVKYAKLSDSDKIKKVKNKQCKKSKKSSVSCNSR